MHQNTNIYVGLDIGTSVIRCVVGQYSPDNPTKVSIIGFGSAESNGMKRGSVIHPEELAISLSNAVSEAERVSGQIINHSAININGVNLTSQASEGVVAISNSSRQITEEDLDRVMHAATAVQLNQNTEIISSYPRKYIIDGNEVVKNPLGMTGVRLEVDAIILTTNRSDLKSLETAMEVARIQMSQHTTSAIAVSDAVMAKQQRDTTTAIVDIGYLTTNIAIMDENEVELVAVLPVGGQSFTNDLAVGLKVDLDLAEKIKLEYATLDNSVGSKNKLDKKDFGIDINVNEIAYIIESRAEELLELIDAKFQSVGKSGKLPGGVIFVGGGCKIPGLTKFAKKILNCHTEIGQIHNVTGLTDIVNKPEFAAATGLMLQDMLLGSMAPDQVSESRIDSIMSTLKNLIRKK